MGKLYLDGKEVLADIYMKGTWQTVGTQKIIATSGMTIGLAASAPDPADGVHIWKATAGAITAPANSLLILENNDDSVFAWMMPDARAATLYFYATTAGRRGYILYNAAIIPEMRFAVANSEQLHLKDGVLDFQKAFTLDLVTGSIIRPPTSDNEYYDLQAYNVNGSAYSSAIRIQNANNASYPIEIGFFGATPVYRQLKADHNNWAAIGDVVSALVNLGLLDAV